MGKIQRGKHRIQISLFRSDLELLRALARANSRTVSEQVAMMVQAAARAPETHVGWQPLQPALFADESRSMASRIAPAHGRMRDARPPSREIFAKGAALVAAAARGEDP